METSLLMFVDNDGGDDSDAYEDVDRDEHDDGMAMMMVVL